MLNLTNFGFVIDGAHYIQKLASRLYHVQYNGHYFLIDGTQLFDRIPANMYLGGVPVEPVEVYPSYTVLGKSYLVRDGKFYDFLGQEIGECPAPVVKDGIGVDDKICYNPTHRIVYPNTVTHVTKDFYVATTTRELYKYEQKFYELSEDVYHMTSHLGILVVNRSYVFVGTELYKKFCYADLYSDGSIYVGHIIPHIELIQKSKTEFQDVFQLYQHALKTGNAALESRIRQLFI